MPRRINLALVIKKLSLHCIICSESKILYFHHAFSIEKISLDAFFAIKLLWERVAHDGQAVIGWHICVPVSLVSWFCMSLIQRPLSMLGATDLSLILLSEAHRKFQLLISCYWRGTLQSLSLFRVFTNYFVRPTFIHGDVNIVFSRGTYGSWKTSFTSISRLSGEGHSFCCHNF